MRSGLPATCHRVQTRFAPRKLRRPTRPIWPPWCAPFAVCGRKRESREMEHDELALRRQARQERLDNREEQPELTIEELGQRAAEAFLTSQRAVALEEPQVK